MKTLALLTFFICSTSFANLSGVWTGWGKWVYEGSGTPCSEMKLKFTDTADKFVRRGGYFDCGVVALDVGEGEWIKQGGNLLKGGKVVGSISENTLHLEEQYDENVKVISDLTMEAGHFDYAETWYDSNDVVIYEITGRFFKKQ